MNTRVTTEISPYLGAEFTAADKADKKNKPVEQAAHSVEAAKIAANYALQNGQPDQINVTKKCYDMATRAENTVKKEEALGNHDVAQVYADYAEACAFNAAIVAEGRTGVNFRDAENKEIKPGAETPKPAAQNDLRFLFNLTGGTYTYPEEPATEPAPAPANEGSEPAPQ
jgi:hypothetical protein